MENEIMIQEETALSTTNMFENNVLEQAKFLSNSTIVPVQYQRKPENCYVAIDMANRMGVPVMMVMQNLYIVQGKPSWSGTAIKSMLENSGKFEDVETVYVGQPNTDNWGAFVTAKLKKNGKVLKGATVTIKTAKDEGWYNKTGSKWKTMPELMLTYRANAWFARQFAPELLMGLQSVEEVEDVSKPTINKVANPYEKGDN